MAEPHLIVNNLSTYFYSQKKQTVEAAIQNISFSLHKGETVGIIGESGSGKSITLLSLLGLISVEPGIVNGEIIYCNENRQNNLLAGIEKSINIDMDSEGNRFLITKNQHQWDKLIQHNFRQLRGKVISMIFQNPRMAFNPFISIGKQIKENIALHTPITSGKQAKEKAIEWLATVKMDAPAIRYHNNPYGLSGGMCQRAMIAMALASEPEILIADEPTSGLDATIQSNIIDLLANLKERYKKSMLIVSHDFSVIQNLADHVLVYYKGKVVEEGPTALVLDANRNDIHPYTKQLLNAGLNNINPINSEDRSIHQGCAFFPFCKETKTQQERCENEAPLLVENNNRHKVACWRVTNG